MIPGSIIASGMRYDGIGRTEAAPSPSISLSNNVRKTNINFWNIITYDPN